MNRRILIALSLCLFTLGAFAQQRETRDVSRFDEVKLRTSAKVYITQGNKNELIVEGDRDDLEDIRTEVRGGELEISNRRDSGWNFWGSSRSNVNIYITVVELQAVTVSGSGDIIGKTLIKADDFRAAISGSGDIEMEIDAGRLDTRISGSGNIELIGAAKSGSLSISGSGKLLAEDLKVDDFDVRISGSGRGSITVYGDLDVRISGSGGVYYSGKPTSVNTNVSGSGKVRRIN